MINLTCQLDWIHWVPRYLTIISGCLWQCFLMRLTFESVKPIALPRLVEVIQTFEGLNRTKSRGGENLFLSAWLVELGHESSPAFGLRFIPLASLVLRLSDLGRIILPFWINTICFSGFPAYRWLMMGLLSLHSYMSQFFIVNIYDILNMVTLTIHTHTHDCSWPKSTDADIAFIQNISHVCMACSRQDVLSFQTEDPLSFCGWSQFCLLVTASSLKSRD